MASIPRRSELGRDSSNLALEPEQETRVIVALDLGTCSTSVAYLPIGPKFTNWNIFENIGDIRVLQGWPTHEHPCVPAEISYTPSPKGCRQWGYDIDDHSKVFNSIRMGLEDQPIEHELHTFVSVIYDAQRSNIAASVDPGLYKSQEQIARDYLHHIAEQVLDELVCNVGRRVPENLPIDLVVSYPSLWGEANKRRYFQVLKSAFGPVFPKLRHLYFVGETYATAYWGILSLWQRNYRHPGREPREGTSILVCKSDRERGYSLVIAAVYGVVNIDDDKVSFQLQRVGYESKTYVGWSKVDQAFESHLRYRLDPEDADKLFKRDYESSHPFLNAKLRMTHARFEVIRDSFDGNDQKLGFPVHLPQGIGREDKPEMGLLNGAIKISVNDLKSFYDPSVDSIIGLLSRQIELADQAGAPVKAIALSGSFANQLYVSHRIQEFGRSRRIEVAGHYGRDRRVYEATAPGSISCVVNSGKEIPVHVLTKHYGIVHSPKFDRTKHRPEDLRIGPDNDNGRVQGQIKWLLTKSEAIFPDAESPRCERLDIIRKFRQQDFVPGKVSRIGFVSCTCSVDCRPNRMLDLGTQKDSTCSVINLDFDLSLVPEAERKSIEHQDAKPKGRLFGKSPLKRLYVEIRLSAEANTDVSGVKFSVSCGSRILVTKNIAHSL